MCPVHVLSKLSYLPLTELSSYVDASLLWGIVHDLQIGVNFKSEKLWKLFSAHEKSLQSEMGLKNEIIV